MPKGIIICTSSNVYQVVENEKVYKCLARGKFKKEKISPLVGDEVEFTITNSEKQEGVIEQILPRKNELKRPKMANISQLIFVISAKNPTPDLLMLDKQLAFAEFLKIKPIIVINKVDLDNDIANNIEQVYSKIGYKVIKTDAKLGIGVDEIKKVLKNKISAFSGNSGVGKSTLINDIFEENITKEGEISLKNKKGKNTTTITSLYEVERNTYLADTPGFSTFDISEISYKELDKYFKEFKNEIASCEFVGCTHVKEQNCAIKKLLQEGKISNSRYENYCKIYLELKDKEEHKW